MVQIHARQPRARGPLVPALCCVAALAASGCNLVRGVGQDMAAVGRTLTKVSGTENNRARKEAGADHQAFDPSYQDQPYHDPAYADPSGSPR